MRVERQVRRKAYTNRLNKITPETWVNSYHPNYTQSTMSVYDRANQKLVDEWGAQYRAMFPRGK